MRSGHEGRRSRASGGFKGRRRDNLVQRPAAHRSAVRTGDRGDAQLGDSRPGGATAHASQSPLRLSRAALDARLQRLRLRDLERGDGEPAAPASEQLVVIIAAASTPRLQNASAISARWRLQQQKRQVSWRFDTYLISKIEIQSENVALLASAIILKRGTKGREMLIRRSDRADCMWKFFGTLCRSQYAGYRHSNRFCTSRTKQPIISAQQTRCPCILTSVSIFSLSLSLSLCRLLSGAINEFTPREKVGPLIGHSAITIVYRENSLPLRKHSSCSSFPSCPLRAGMREFRSREKSHRLRNIASRTHVIICS